MERESFEDEEVAKLMNDNFVSIKVDKEERPDINSVYMDITQKITGSGGWPLTVITTPDKIPFFISTYIPKEGRNGKMGLLELIPKINKLWGEEKEKLKNEGFRLMDSIKKSSSEKARDIDESILDDAFNHLSYTFDENNGGFGTSPKFPTPHKLLFLLRYAQKEDDDWASSMVYDTLEKIRYGGIYDQIGFGFHRYSTDAKWILPHFEKMLYDQGMILLAYLEAYQISKKKLFRDTVEEIISYINRNLKNEDSGYYSSEDAETGGREGEYYTWTKKEIEEIIGENSKLFIDFFNIKDKGNFKDEARGVKTGRNVLYSDVELEKLAKKSSLSLKEIERKIQNMRSTLFEDRLKRESPNVDNKILTDWNSLIIVGLSKAGFILNSKEYLEMAEKSIRFILDNLVKEDQIFHVYVEEDVSIEGLLDDYSFLIWALLALYESTFKLGYLQKAIYFSDIMIERFWDREKGGFFLSKIGSEELPLHKKELYDGAYPSGNSIAFMDLIHIYKITGDSKYRNFIEKMINTFSGKLVKNPAQYTMFMSALFSWWGRGQEIVVVRKADEEKFEEIIDVLRKNFLPNCTLLVKDEENEEELEDITGYISSMKQIKGKTTVYICEDFTCREPTNSVKTFENIVLGKD